MAIFKKIREEVQQDQETIYGKMCDAVKQDAREEINALMADWPSNKSFGYERIMPALMYSVEKNNLELAAILITCGVDVEGTHYYLAESFDASDYPNGTPLSHAVTPEMVELLIRHGADVNALDGQPLKNAISQQNLEMFQLLIENKADTRKWAVEFLKKATQGDSFEIVDLLIQHGADVNTTLSPWERTPLMNAADRGNLEIVRLLVQHGADVNTVNKEQLSALLIAVANRHVDIARHLVEHGADVNVKNADDRPALSLAIENESLEIAQLLIRHSTVVSRRNKERLSALTFWRDENTREIVRLLIRNNLIESKKLSSREKERIKELMDMGVHVKTVGHENSVVLMYAVGELFSHKDALLNKFNQLIEEGADVNARSEKGQTVLMLAAKAVYSVGNLEAVVEYLIEKGVDVNARTDAGATALMNAASMGNAEAVKPLVEAGADVNAQNNDGTTALVCAASRIQSARYPSRFLGTITALVQFGAGLEPLMALLKDPQLDIRLAAVKALGEIRSTEAVGPLIDLLAHDAEEQRLTYFVLKTLKEITGQDLGNTPDNWQRWWEQNKS